MNSIIVSLTVDSFSRTQSESKDNLKVKTRLGDFPITVEVFGKLASIELKPKDNIVATGSLKVNGSIILLASKLEVVPVALKLNHVSLAGHVGKDPETRYFESGKVVSNCSLAVRRSKEQTDWFKVTAWERQAEILTNHVQKGSTIGVTGRLSFESWTDQTSGKIKSRPVVQIDQLSLLGGSKSRTLQAEELDF